MARKKIELWNVFVDNVPFNFTSICTLLQTDQIWSNVLTTAYFWRGECLKKLNTVLSKCIESQYDVTNQPYLLL